MRWTDRLNGDPGHLRLGHAGVDIYHWAEMADTVVNPPHRHTYFEVCWVEDGHGEFIVDDETHHIGPDSLLFARPGVTHRIISAEPPGIRLAWVAFHLRTPSDVEDELDELFSAFASSARAVAADTGRRVAALWAALRAAGGDPPIPGQQAAADAVARALLVTLAQAGAENPRRPMKPVGTGPSQRFPAGIPRDTGLAVIRQALRYVEDNLDRPLTVDELARHVHVSRRQLSRLFAEHAGRAPAAYVQRARLDRAAALLVRTDLPIKQIAASTGYPDVTQFTRAFSRSLGTPPGRFRQAADLSAVLSAGPDRQAGGPPAS